MGRIILCCIACLLTSGFFSCREHTKPSNPGISGSGPNSPQYEPTISYIVFEVENGFGYDIYIDGKKTIHQPAIPAIGGNRPFATKEQATKTADLVVMKLRNNNFPPSLTAHELDTLGVWPSQNTQ